MNTPWRVVGFVLPLFGIGITDTWAQEPEYVQDEVLVKYEESVSDGRIGEIEEEFGLTLIRVLPLIDVKHYKTADGADVSILCENLSALSEVRYAEPNYTRQLLAVNDPYFPVQWSLHNTGHPVNNRIGPADIDIDWPEAMEVFTGSIPVIVAVIDSGVSLFHEDIKSQLWWNPVESAFGIDGKDNDNNGWVDDFNGIDLSGVDSEPFDRFGHGTLVASIIAAASDNNKGVSGVCPTVKIMAVRILDGFGRGGAKFLPNVGVVCIAVDYALRMGARILNLSFGRGSPSTPEYELFEKVRELGVLSVASAGNDGINNDLAGNYPANYPSEAIISVANTLRSGSLSLDSNYGSFTVDIAAPGTDIFGATVGRTVLIHENFDGDLGSWVFGSETGNQSSFNWSRGFDGTNGFLYDGSGALFSNISYQSNTRTWIRSPAYDLSLFRQARLEIGVFHRLSFDFLLDSVDLLFVEVSDDRQTWFPYRQIFGDSTDFAAYSVDISDFDGSSTCYIRFLLITDSIFQNDGVFVDYLSLTAKDDFSINESVYDFDSGTSFSAPIVTGVAALIMSQRPDLSHHQVKDILLSTVDKRQELDGLMVSGGTVNAHKALLAAKALPPRFPEIVQQPVGGTINIGGEISLWVTVVSPITASFQWRREGVDLPGFTQTGLIIDGVSTEQTGAFTCAITNSAGTTISEAAVVTVIEPPAVPSITVQPMGVELEVEDPLSLSVEATGTEPLSYQWFKNNSTIQGATSANLEVLNVSMSDGGDYKCVVTNSVGSIESDVAVVVVKETALVPSITIQPISVELKIGETIDLSVVATGTAPLSYQWYKDGAKIQGATKADLERMSVSQSDAGAYRVVVTNANGSVTSETAVVVVKEKSVAPAIMVQPVDTEVELGGTLHLSVEVTGTEPLAYQWYGNNVVIPTGNQAELEVQGVSEADAGYYRCRITNSAGGAFSVAVRVNVVAALQPANITVGPKSVAVYEGGTMTLSVTSTGSVPMTYQWFKGDVALIDENSATLTVSGAEYADTGNYSVRVANSAGEDSAVFTVTVLSPSRGSPAFANLSNRGQVQAGSGVLIPGFVITGNAQKRLLIRGIGPALEDFGLSGALEKPEMTLIRDGNVVVHNAGWETAANDMEIDAVGDLLGAFGLKSGNSDSAMFVSLEPSSYTVRLGGENNTTGLGLVEVYDADPGSDSKLVNLSVRAHVGTGNDILIPGLVIIGNSQVKILLRAVGPTLTRFGLGNVLGDPHLSVISGSNTIVENDNWTDNPGFLNTAAVAKTVGAFELDNGSFDAAVVVNLNPGAYTVKVSGVGGLTGICLVEVYYVE